MGEPGSVPPRLRVAQDNPSVLVERARRLASAGGRRLLGFAGAPGAGKSTTAAALVSALGPAAALVPMDGFHLAEAELHRLGRHERKGAVDTFDASGYVSLLRRLRQPEPATVWAPRFHRELEEAIAGSIPVEPSVPLVITEGNYLLVDAGPWAAVRELLDEIWFVELPEEVRLARLTARHEAYTGGGRGPSPRHRSAQRRTDRDHAPPRRPHRRTSTRPGGGYGADRHGRVRHNQQVTTDLAETLGRQETAALEFKREAKDRHAVRKAICALANDLPGLGGPARPMVPWAAHRPSCSGAESTLMS